MNSSPATHPRAVSLVPAAAPIELAASYEEFAGYYPECKLQTKRWFAENARPDWVVFDVGANVGIYAILLSRLAPRGHIHAFEPTETASLLRRNLDFHQARNVSVHPLAVGARTGAFEEPIYRIWGQAPETRSYDFVTLDDFVARAGVDRLDCIKIDVDGFDLDVLKGSARTLERFDPWVVVELNHALATRGQSAGEAMLWLLGQGYTQALVLDDENFLLKRGPEGGPGAGDTLALAFDRRPVMLPRAFVPGETLRNYFSDEPVRHNEAVIERNEAGFTISAPGPRWSFAAGWPRKAETEPAGQVLIRVRVEVMSGAVGLGCLASDYRAYVGKEVRLAAAPACRTAEILAPESSDVACLMIRNVSEAGAPATARVLSIQASVAVPAAPSLSPLLDHETRWFDLPPDPAAAGAAGRAAPGGNRPIRIVPVEELGQALGFHRPFVPEKRVYRYGLEEFVTETDESAIFRYLYRNFRPARHLEFGTWEGFGAVLCAGSCAARIWTINLPEGERDAHGAPLYPGRPPEAQTRQATGRHEAPSIPEPDAAGPTDAGSRIGWRYRAAGFAERVTQILCDSRDFAAGEFAPGFFDTILIDGGHQAGVVASDTAKALPLLRSGGLIMWHDFCPDPRVLQGSAAVRGVVGAVSENLPSWRASLSDLFWVRPSHLLIGVKA